MAWGNELGKREMRGVKAEEGKGRERKVEATYLLFFN